MKPEVLGRIAMNAYGKIVLGTPLSEIHRIVGEAIADAVKSVKAQGYVLTYDVAYEGLQEQHLETLDAVVEWLKNNRSAYDFSLDNVTVRPLTDLVDIYKLMESQPETDPSGPGF